MALPHASPDEFELFRNDADGTRSYPATDQALRKSCDRCYAQKLKCSKSDASPSRCMRCQRAGLRCFYSTRLARQAPKRRASPLENVIVQKSTRPFRQQPLPSPSAEEHAGFDPMSMVTFDHDSHGLANSTFYGEVRSEYVWPPEDWLTGPELSSTYRTVPTADQSLLGHLPETRMLEPPDAAGGSGSEPPPSHINPLDNQYPTEQLREASAQQSSGTDVSNSSVIAFPQANQSYQEVIPDHLAQSTFQERSSTGAGTSSEPKVAQATSLDELACLARRLENFHHKMSTAEPFDLQSCKLPELTRSPLLLTSPDPVGATLDGSRTLLNILRQDISLGVMQCYNPYLRGSPYDPPPSSSRMTNSLLALQCYILCVKITARMCQRLLSQPAMVAESEVQAKRQDRGGTPSRNAASVPSTPDERPNDLVDDALAIPLYSDLRLGELHSHLDPLGHSMNCICETLGAGLKLLRGIEASLGIPKVLGVACESLPTAERNQANISDRVGSAGSEPTTPILTLTRRSDSQQQYFDPRVRSNSVGTQPFLERIITVLWDEETMVEASTGSQETALAVLRRCSKQILTLARQHMLFSYSG